MSKKRELLFDFMTNLDDKGYLRFGYDVDEFITDYLREMKQYNILGGIDNLKEKRDMKNYKELEHEVVKWASKKGILENGTTDAQANKTVEEALELYKAVKLNDEEEIIDGLGDVFVTIIIQAKMQNKDLLECLQVALDVITKRTGKMVNGTFVKD